MRNGITTEKIQKLKMREQVMKRLQLLRDAVATSIKVTDSEIAAER